MFDELPLKVVYLAGMPLVSFASHKSIKLNCVEIDGFWVLGSSALFADRFSISFFTECKFRGYLWLH